MADRTAAGAFGSAFAWQLKHHRPKLTQWLWSLASEYDFAPHQMRADEQLLKLKLISKKDAGPEPSSALSFGPASLDALFKVFERDGDATRSAELVRLSGKKDPLAASGPGSSGAGEEKWVNRHRHTEYGAGRAFAPVQPKDSAGDLFSDVGKWVSEHRGIAIGLAALAGAIALAPAVANAAAPTPMTPEQQAQASVDRERAISQSNGLKIAAGGFAIITAATVVYAITNEEPKKASFHPVSLR